MVINNRANVSRFSGLLPQSDDEPREIDSGPLYMMADVQSLAATLRIHFWSRGAVADAQKWSLSIEDVAELIKLAMESGSYKGAEWCKAQPAGPWAACDAYTVSRLEWNQAAHKEMRISYYLKFAISKTGSVLLSASNHPEGT